MYAHSFTLIIKAPSAICRSASANAQSESEPEPDDGYDTDGYKDDEERERMEDMPELERVRNAEAIATLPHTRFGL